MIAQAFESGGQRNKRLALAEGLAAAEGHASQQGIAPDIGQDIPQSNGRAAPEIMGVGIVAAGASVRAALGEQHIAQARSVHDGFGDASGYPDHAVSRRGRQDLIRQGGAFRLSARRPCGSV